MEDIKGKERKLIEFIFLIRELVCKLQMAEWEIRLLQNLKDKTPDTSAFLRGRK